LSPLDLNESEGALNSKLKELYKSYELESEREDEVKETPLKRVSDFFKQLKLE